MIEPLVICCLLRFYAIIIYSNLREFHQSLRYCQDLFNHIDHGAARLTLEYLQLGHLKLKMSESIVSRGTRLAQLLCGRGGSVDSKAKSILSNNALLDLFEILVEELQQNSKVKVEYLWVSNLCFITTCVTRLVRKLAQLAHSQSSHPSNQSLLIYGSYLC